MLGRDQSKAGAKKLASQAILEAADNSFSARHQTAGDLRKAKLITPTRLEIDKSGSTVRQQNSSRSSERTMKC